MQLLLATALCQPTQTNRCMASSPPRTRKAAAVSTATHLQTQQQRAVLLSLCAAARQHRLALHAAANGRNFGSPSPQQRWPCRPRPSQQQGVWPGRCQVDGSAARAAATNVAGSTLGIVWQCSRQRSITHSPTSRARLPCTAPPAVHSCPATLALPHPSPSHPRPPASPNKTHRRVKRDHRVSQELDHLPAAG